MAVRANSSENAFTPFRGTEQQIQAFPVTPGGVYFAYDTNKIFFDDGNSQRHVMSGSGIKFVYGECVETLVPTDESNGLLPYPRQDIDMAYALINMPTETYQREDIITLSFLHRPTFTSIHDHWKNHSLHQTDFCWQGNISAFQYASQVGHNFPSKE